MTGATIVRCSGCLEDVSASSLGGEWDYCQGCTDRLSAELRHKALRAAAHHLHEAGRMKFLAREYGAAEIEIERVIPYPDYDFELTVEGL